MSGWSVPELGAARINAACVLCIVPAGSVSLLLPGFIFFKLSNLTFESLTCKSGICSSGKPHLVYFFFCIHSIIIWCAVCFLLCQRQGALVQHGPGYLLTHRINSLGVFTVSTLVSDTKSSRKLCPVRAQVSETLGVFWAEQGLIRWQCPLTNWRHTALCRM